MRRWRNWPHICGAGAAISASAKLLASSCLLLAGSVRVFVRPSGGNGKQPVVVGQPSWHWAYVQNWRATRPVADADPGTSLTPRPGGFQSAVRIGSKSVSSRSDLFCFASGRVLVVHGGVFGCSSRMNGKPSSPVLRGLGASDGARLLDHLKIPLLQ